MIKISDVAKKAGVSNSTVSNVLNDSKYVSDELKKKVFRAVKELNYVPNMYAQGLKSTKTNKIGIITNDVVGLFYPYIISEISKVVEPKGYQLIIMDTGSDIEKEKFAFREMIKSNVDGIIFSSSISHEKEKKHISEILKFKKSRKVILLSIERNFSKYGIHSIYSDMFKVGYDATNHLIDRGAKKIAHITGPINSAIVQDRLLGYAKALEENKMNYDPEIVMNGNYTHQEGYIATKALFENNDSIDGIFTVNDQTAFGAYLYVKETDMQIKTNIKIIGVDNVYVSELIDPKLSTIHIQKEKIGNLAANYIIDLINNKILEKDTINIKLEHELIIREST